MKLNKYLHSFFLKQFIQVYSTDFRMECMTKYYKAIKTYIIKSYTFKVGKKIIIFGKRLLLSQTLCTCVDNY